MAHREPSAVDIKALTREVRAAGIAIGKEASQLHGADRALEAQGLVEAGQDLNDLAETLEAWRLHRAEALRQISLSMAKLTACLKDPGLHSELGIPASGRELFNDAARLAEGAALGCAEIALQLDSSVTEEVTAHVR